jgi:UDP-N-acetylmuramate--alanine ligase
MVVHVLRECGMDPAYLVGGEPRDTGRNAGWGEGEWIVVEADESDRSLLRLRPEIAVVTNLELDHHTTYSSHLELEETVRDFLAGGEQAVLWDRPELRALRAGPVQTFDVTDPEAGPDGVGFTWEGRKAWVGLPGVHNALNAAASLTAVRLAGADPGEAVAALAGFRGTRRRFERVGQTAAGGVVYDDYAHHPTEVRATIAAARTLGPGRVVAVFQPHLYSRTAALWREFGAALALADLPVVLDVYRAREDPARWPGISGRLVAEAAADAAGGRTVAWLPGFDDAEPFLRERLRDGDLCLTLGAGDVDELGRRLVQ